MLKLSDPHKEKDAGGTPALPGANHSPLEGESQKPSPKAKADAVGGKPGDSSGAAKRRLSRGRKPMEQSAHTPEPRRRRQHVAGRKPCPAKQTRAANRDPAAGGQTPPARGGIL